MIWDSERWKYWNPKKLTCPCGCGLLAMSPDFLDRMMALRRLLGVPLYETSGSRCAAYDELIGSSTTPGRGPHTVEGSPDEFTHAMDFGIQGATVYEALPILRGLGFTGIGIKLRGDARGRYMHLDDLPAAEDRFRPTVWTY